MISITECPRDAMQGIDNFIPTEKKIAYINQLLTVGFDVVDFGSFVSAKAIPQMRDTSEVLTGLDLGKTKSKLLVIIANLRGAQVACQFEEINFLGFPFSVSEEFQLRNTNASREKAFQRVADIAELASRHEKELVVYLSMAFGNPYRELWSPELVAEWTRKIGALGIKKFALSDTIGNSNPDSIKNLFGLMTKEFPDYSWTAHLHTTPPTWKEKVESAFQAGCRSFDGALKGYGGCPMAEDKLTGNMPTEKLIDYLQKQEKLNIDEGELRKAMDMSISVFPN